MSVKDGGLAVGTPLMGTHSPILSFDSSLICVTVKVKPTARLSAVRHHVARKQTDSALGNSAQLGHFEDDQCETISLDKTVQEVKGSAATCKLTLSISPSNSEVGTSDVDSSDDGSDDTRSNDSDGSQG